MNLKKNFICISSFNDNLDWFRKFDYPHVIYEKCHMGVNKSKYYPYLIAPSNTSKKYPKFNVIEGEINGYNLNEYLTYIIDNYEKLPETIVFIKGNILERHVSIDFLRKIINNKYFTSIEECYEGKFKKKLFNHNASLVSSDGGWLEINNNWYLNKPKHPTRYFNSFNTFMKFILKNYNPPKYIRFCPGANYIVPRYNVLKFSKYFYQNLKFLVGYSQLSGESHILERSLYSIWNSTYEESEIMKKPFNQNIVFPKKDGFMKIITTKFFSKIT